MPISFWVKGVPRSLAAQKKEAYTALIQEAARCVFEKPVQSPRIDIAIIFAAKDRNLRADVDNVAKPILDASKDIVYDDDKEASLHCGSDATDWSARKTPESAKAPWVTQRLAVSLEVCGSIQGSAQPTSSTHKPG
jgi:hypothetical protein